MAAGEELPGLGLKTDRPRLNTAVDLSRLKLTPTEGFILSRVDGFASYDEICRMSGLGREETLAVLRKLKQENLFLEPSRPATAPQASRAPPPEPRSLSQDRRSPSPDRRTPSPERPAKLQPSPAAVSSDVRREVEEQDRPRFEAGRAGAASMLERLDDGQPVAPADLVEGTDLSQETKRRILRLHRRLRKLAPHELLGVAENAEAAVVRKAFAAASKELHPDRYFGKDLGSFRQKLAQIFSRMSEAAQTMQKARKGRK